jgi:hypothetical protein
MGRPSPEGLAHAAGRANRSGVHAPPTDPWPWQAPRYRTGQSTGHYESWFLRANHPTRREGFWIRHTIFVPHARPADAIGELWAIHFDGESGRIVAGKLETPLATCAFAPDALDVRIGDATLVPGHARGAVAVPGRLRWDLRYDGGGRPLLFLRPSLYDGGFPRAKSVTPRPLVRFSGTLEVGEATIAVGDWIGSENHNWGPRHTDTYAWGQVAGFDDDPTAFLEVATAQLKYGPFWTPRLTMLVLRLGDDEIRLNGLATALRARGRWRWFRWDFDSREDGVRVRGHVSATPADFVGLTYYNPPGGTHQCLNSKVAACEIVVERRGHAPRTLATASRAAFEILTDAEDHGIPIVV